LVLAIALAWQPPAAWLAAAPLANTGVTGQGFEITGMIDLDDDLNIFHHNKLHLSPEIVRLRSSGRLVAVAAAESHLVIYDPVAGQALHSLLSYDTISATTMLSVKTYAENERVLAAVATLPWYVHVVDIESGKVVRSIRTLCSEDSGLAVHRYGGKTIGVVGAQHGVDVLDLTGGTILKTIKVDPSFEPRFGRPTVFEHRGQLYAMISAGSLPFYYVLDLVAGSVVQRIPTTRDNFTVIHAPAVFTQDGAPLAVIASPTARAQIVKPLTGEIVRNLDIDLGYRWIQVDPQIFSAQGRTLCLVHAMAPENVSVLYVFDVRTGQIVTRIDADNKVHDTQVTRIRDRWLVTVGAEDDKIQVFDALSGRELAHGEVRFPRSVWNAAALYEEGGVPYMTFGVWERIYVAKLDL
jgi:hypothetical protein